MVGVDLAVDTSSEVGRCSVTYLKSKYNALCPSLFTIASDTVTLDHVIWEENVTGLTVPISRRANSEKTIHLLLIVRENYILSRGSFI